MLSDGIQELLLASPLRCELRIVEARNDLPQVSIKDMDITLIQDKPSQFEGILLVPEKCKKQLLDQRNSLSRNAFGG